jgi:uncharacterized protein
MTDLQSIFHLAIPSADLDQSAEFYSKLGCRIARRSHDRVTLELLGHQVVCHLSPDKIDKHPEMYPRHFGITFTDERNFERILSTAIQGNVEFFQQPFVRFKGRPEEHRVFFLKDPSNNLVEFKYYNDPNMVY